MTYVATVTIDNTKVSADLTDYVVYIDLADMPALFHSTVTASAGDIRCYKSDGTTELAREVASYDAATDTGELHVKYTGTLSSSSDTEIQIHADGTSSDYAATATFGRNAVWSDYEAVYHLNEAANTTSGGYTDSTGSYDATGVSTTLTEVSGQIGTAQDLDGSADFISIPDAAINAAESANRLTVQGWANLDTLAADATLIGVQSVTPDQFLLYMDADGANAGWRFGVYTPTGTFTSVDTAGAVTDAWQSAYGTWDGSTLSVYTDGSLSDSNTTTGSLASGSNNPGIGSGNGENATRLMNGQVDEIRIRASALSADWIATEYNNQSSPGTFYTAVEPSAVDFTLTANQGSFTLTGQAADLTASRLLTANQGSYTLTGQDAILAFTKVLEAAQGSYSLSGQPAGLLASRTLTAGQGSYTLSGQDATLTVTVTLDAEQGSYTFTGQDASLITSRLLEANQGSYSLTGQDATLTFQAAEISPLIAEQGSYSLTGQTADLVVSFKLDAVQGTYTLTGQDVDLIAQLVGDATGAVTRKVFPERFTAKAYDTTTAKVH